MEITENADHEKNLQCTRTFLQFVQPSTTVTSNDISNARALQLTLPLAWQSGQKF